MTEDPELLRRFAEEKSQEAFAELVRRRVDLVYSVALRHVGGDAHLAQDVTQKVFVDLARKAGMLSRRSVLSGWLYRSTQYAASDTVRSERRRRAREQESQTRHEIARPAVSPDEWTRLRPLIDEALGELNDEDRDAVALRFFEDRPFAEIGRALRLTEDAARKRVERALDKLGGALSRRGVTSTSTALGAVLAGHAAAAPAGLASSVSAQAVAGMGAATAGGWAFFTSAKFTASVAAAAAVIGFGVALQQRQVAQQREREAMALRSAQAEASARLAQIEARLKAAETRARAAEQDSVELLTAVERLRASRAIAMSTAAVIPANTSTSDNDGPITRDTVDARYRRGQELARAGRAAEALREFEWCLDRGMPAVVGYTGVRRSFLLSDIERLGETGRALLQARRAAAEQALQAGGGFDAAADFAALNRTLGEPDRTLAFYDQLPAADARRRPMSLVVYEQLVDRQRYAEAAQTRSFATMLRSFELDTRPRTSGASAAPEIVRAQRSYTIRTAARNIEVLAGAGNVTDARAFAGKLLAFDGSPETKTLLQTHVARAGQPDLLGDLSGR